MLSAEEKKLHQLFEELVPPTGKADTEAGELVRAICRIGYRSWNDGDHIGIGYGKETCNPAARYLIARGGAKVRAAVEDAWGIYNDSLYDKAVSEIERAVIDLIEQHPELKETPNGEDMFDFRNKDEDIDDTDEDDWF